MKKIKSIVIICRRWFNRGPGNSYHSCTAYVDGKAMARIDFCYGYGNQYEYTAMQKLSELGIIKGWDNQKDSPWGYCDRNGIAYSTECCDVTRKSDL